MSQSFIDYVRIHVEGGAGGNGCCSFAHFKDLMKGGPDGANGGNGGNVIIKAQHNLLTLLDVKMKPLIRAQRGQHGKGGDKLGRRGKDAYVMVPMGTVVSDEDGNVVCDLTEDKQSFVVAYGGRGGRGNKSFASSRNRTPRNCEEGKPGEEKTLFLELKLIADIGFVGLPNAGKSTLLSKLTAATPKIASYPFTTLHPNLGVLSDELGHTIVLADIPGLIEGAHSGIGLGDKFLKHIERTKILVHVVGLDDFNNITDYLDAYNMICDELRFYSDTMLKKPQIVVINKTDLEMVNAHIDEIKELFTAQDVECIFISALNKDHLNDLAEKMFETVRSLKEEK